MRITIVLVLSDDERVTLTPWTRHPVATRVASPIVLTAAGRD